MNRLALSIRTKLILFMVALIAIMVGLGTLAISRLVAIDETTEALGDRWLAATQVLNSLDDRVSDFRIAEIYRVLAEDSEQRSSDELLAEQHRRAADGFLKQYIAILGEDRSKVDTEAFAKAWVTYTTAHDRWVSGDPDGLLHDPAQAGSPLHRLYRATANEIDRMIEANKTIAVDEARGADELVDGTILLMLVASIITILLAVGLLFRMSVDVIRPLGAMTTALSKLAAGNRDVEVPEVERTDEIGEMAKAFDVFRGNAQALRLAHEAARTAQEQAQALARHDALTGLPNRRVFAAELEKAILHARRGAVIYSVLMIDLDRFKPVNDLQGHPVGDLVLCEVARRLTENVRRNDTVARLGGDEFAIIAETAPGTYPEGTIRLANRILTSIREPIRIGESDIEIGASIGIASCPADGSDSEELLRSADIAMYRAKRDGRGTFRFFEQSMDEELRAQAALETDLKNAISEEQIRPHYQPLMDMRADKLYGFEILARWHHPQRGWISPETFIPLTEQLGMIGALTWSILRQACRDAAEWPADVHLSLNISPGQLKDPVLPTQLLTILNQEGFTPSRLEIEVTETALVGDIETAKLVINALQSVGIKVSLDDFGTGYSSLYHLRELKFDKVKIDRSFVQSMEENGESEKIVDAILSLAQNLGMPTVAEGIEKPSTLEHLSEMGCEYGQGFYFGQAMTPDSVTELVRTRVALENVG